MTWLTAVIVLPYLLILLWIYFKILKARPFEFQPFQATSVSVIIPCRNEEHNIIAILRDLAAQDYPSNLLEIIVVDDNSDDLTRTLVEKESFGPGLKLLGNKGAGKKEAIRTGVMNSSADLIITTDADCRIGKNWLRSIISFNEKAKADIIICPVATSGAKGFTGRFQELEFLGLQAITAGTALAGNATMCNGANLAFSKAAYLKNCGNLHYEINSGDDIFLLHSIKKQRASKIVWLESKDAIVTTDSEKRICSLLNQRKRWISKSTYYRDCFTILLGIVTFVTIAAQGILMLATIINHSFLAPFLLVLAMKSIPDWLLIKSATVRYNIKTKLAWFIPAQIVYPIYLFVLLLWPGPAAEKKLVPHF